MGKASREKQERRQQEQSFIGISLAGSFLEKIYLIIIEAGVYLVLFTPFVTNTSFFFPYVSPKTIFFRIIVEIIFIIYILLAIANRRYLPRISFLTAAIGIFWLISILSSLFGINFAKSFWSVFERMTGLLTLTHLLAFFIILTSCFKERRYWERILTVSVLVGVLISFNALIVKDPSSNGGTLGNVSFLAAYMLFNIFFAIILFFAKSIFWKIFYGLSLLVMFLPLLNTPEFPRGFFGAFSAGLFMLATGYLFFSGKTLFKKIAPFVLVLAILGFLAIVQTSFFKTTFMDISEVPGEARKLVWEIGFKGWQERPWLGWGLENFNVVFTKYFHPFIPLTGDIWYDRVHNIVLDTLVETGIVGFLSYLVIFGVAIFGLLKLCSRVTNKRNLFLPLGMAVLLLVYFAQNFFVFDMISSYLVFFLSLAFINFLLVSGNEDERTVVINAAGTSSQASVFLGAFLIIISIFTLYFGNIQPARASRLIIKGLMTPLDQSLAAFQEALAMSPLAKFEAPEQFSRQATNFSYQESQDRATVVRMMELSAGELEKSITKNPLDFRLFLLLGREYNDFYVLTNDDKKLDLADRFLIKAAELSSNNQQAYWALGQTRIFQGRNKEAIEFFQKAVELDSRFGPSHWYLAMAYKVIGDNQSASREAQAAEEAPFKYNWRGDLGNLKSVIEIYQNLEQDAVLIELYSLAVKMNSEDPKLWAGLAVSQANIKDYKNARESAEKAIALKPDFASQLEDFLKSLPQ